MGIKKSLADKVLMFLHNTSAEKLARIDKMGGMPMPSIAVTKKDIPFEGFGDITMVGKPESFDPKASKLNEAFSADAYTVRAPQPVRVAKKGAGKRFQKDLEDKLKDLGAYTSETSSNIWDLQKKGGVDKSTFDQVSRFLESDSSIDALFLESKGVKPPRKSELMIDGKKVSQIAGGGPIGKALGEGKTAEQAINEATEFYAGVGGKAQERGMVGVETFRDNISNLKAVAKKAPGDIDRSALQNAASKYGDEREQFSKNLIDDYFEPEEYFISNPDRDRYTTGAKLKPYDADEITKFMKKQAGVGGEGGIASKSAGAVRASTTEKIKSLQGMRDIQDRLVTADDMAEFKQTSGMMLDDLQEAFKDHYKYDSNSWGYRDEFNEFVKMSETMGIDRAAKEVGFDVPSGLKEELTEYKDMLRGGVTEYFESKPKRVVTLDEFGGAIVPKGTPQSTLDMLNKAGIRTETYASEAGKLAARRKFKEHLFTGAGVGVGVGLSTLSSEEASARGNTFAELQKQRKQRPSMQDLPSYTATQLPILSEKMISSRPDPFGDLMQGFLNEKKPAPPQPDKIEGPNQAVPGWVHDLGFTVQKIDTPFGKPAEGIGEYLQKFGYDDPWQERLKRAAGAGLDLM